MDEVCLLYSEMDDLTRSIAETASWDSETWQQRRIAAIDWAFGRHADDLILRPIVETWSTLWESQAKASEISETSETSGT